MIRASRSLVLTLVVFACQAVCADETKTVVSQVQASATASVTIGESDEQKIEVREGDWKSVQEFVAAQKGKIVVVDIWSTACLPCMREFPNLVSLQQKYGKEIVCVSLNVDYVGIKSKPPAYYQPRVEKFLNSRKAAFRNYICSVDAIDLFDELKINSIPAVFVYGKDGTLAKKFDDTLLADGEEEAFDYEHDINPFIEALMKQAPAKVQG